MILTCQVYAKIAGHSAANFAKNNELIPLPHDQIEEETVRYRVLRSINGSIKPHHIKKELQEIMWRHVLVIRGEDSLTIALEKLRSLREKCQSQMIVSNNKELMNAIEAENLILVGEIITRAALLRKETRGSHFRVDFPSRNDKEFLYRIASHMQGDNIEHRTLESEKEWVRSYPYEIVHA